MCGQRGDPQPDNVCDQRRDLLSAHSLAIALLAGLSVPNMCQILLLSR